MSAGNLYGTTDIGGATNDGTVFKVTPVSGGGYTESILYNFGATATDGQNPRSSLLFDGNGITVTSTGGFTGTVNLSCAVTPVPGAVSPTCTLSSPSTTISGATTTQTTTLTVVTAASNSTAANQSRQLFWPGAGGAALGLAFFLSRGASGIG